ncbi:serine protease 38-like [Cololabis saira]|uniref:serine protease 38-like n=1 Tax=Cololabis saira TaxID=129043 RepID=UPI002AD2F6F8|nr:serine protease 38-like [Cololabis saira]
MMHTLHNLMLLSLLTFLQHNAQGSEIVRGAKVPDNSMLYMASVQIEGKHSCGGFLVSEDFVLTAAHCNHKDFMTVVLGTHNLKKVNDGTMRYNITRCIHKDYKGVKYGNDIMLLKLSKKVKLNSKVQPIRLPGAQITVKDKAKCNVAGWGKTKTGGNSSEVLKAADVSVVNLNECRRKWERERELPNNIICAGGYGSKKGFCDGDSGGPLVYNKMAVGIVSFNLKGDCNYPNVPNVYTDISKYIPWIQKILKQKRFCDTMYRLGKNLIFLILTCVGLLAHGSDIINGESAPDNSLLYMASVQNILGHACGGFLINEEWVLTAAHCDDNFITHVIVGSHNLKREKNSKIAIEKKCKHESYKNVGLGDDIMLLKLSSKATISHTIGVIQVPVSDINLEENQVCFVAGWGAIKTEGINVDELRMVNVSVISPQACEREWFGLPSNIICAGGSTVKGFCQGDSGGPLVCGGKAVGIVSFNSNRNCNYPDKPNVYTDTSKYHNWIFNIVKNSC